MLQFILIAAAAAVTAAPIRKPPCANGLVCAWDPASVVRGLQAAGYKAVPTVSDAGKPFLVSAVNGNELSIDFYDCSDEVAKTGCTVLLLGSYYPRQPYLTAELANRFNQSTMFGRAYIGDTGRLELQVPLATDGGIGMAAFRALLVGYGDADDRLHQLVEAAMADHPAHRVGP